MPKQKTNKSCAKRFKVTGTGKIRRRKAGARHLMSSKNGKRKRQFRRDGELDKSERRKIERLMPYVYS